MVRLFLADFRQVDKMHWPKLIGQISLHNIVPSKRKHIITNFYGRPAADTTTKWVPAEERRMLKGTRFQVRTTPTAPMRAEKSMNMKTQKVTMIEIN